MARTAERSPRRFQRTEYPTTQRFEALEDDVDDIVDEMSSLRALFWKVVGGVALAVLSFLLQVVAVIVTRGSH